MFKSKLALQIVLATLITILATAAIVSATTIGNNIYTTGTLGIGTSSPSQSLSIVGKLYTTGGIQFPDGSLQTAAASAASLSSAGQVAFYNTDGSTVSGTSTLFITPSGFVGVGTTSPNWKFSVAGQGSFDDLVRASYFTATSTTATSTFAGLVLFSGNMQVGTTTVITSCNGVDDTVVIQNALNSYGIIQLPSTTCVVSNLVLTRDVQIQGNGPASVLYFKSGSIGWLLDGSTYGVYLKSLTLDGGLSLSQQSTSVAGTRNGVQLNATVHNSGLFGVVVRGFSNIGIGLSGNPNLYAANPMISNNNIYNNYTGIQTNASYVDQTGGEYSRIAGNSISYNRYGMILNSGNISVVNNSIVQNGYGVTIAYDGNGGKEEIVGNSINHSSVYAIYASSTAAAINSSIISGNQSQLGDWYIKYVAGWQIYGNVINATNMTLMGGSGSSYGGNRFTNNYITNAGTVLTTDSNFFISDNIFQDNTYFNGIRSLSGNVSVGPNGTNMLSNGNFADSTGWTVGSAWSIGSGVATTNSSPQNSYLYHALNAAPVNGQTYYITYTISGGGGTFAIGLGGNDVTPNITNGNGTFSQTITPTNVSNSILYLITKSGSFSITNIIVQPAWRTLNLNTTADASDELDYNGLIKSANFTATSTTATSTFSGGAVIATGGGLVGIGTSTPAATLDIEGYMRLKKNIAQPVACSTSNAGAIALSSSYLGCVCNGTGWIYIGSSTQACVW